MKIIGLDGKKYSWNFTKYVTQSEHCSSLHLRARLLLNELYPYDIVYEEVIIPGIKTEINNRPLLLDFYINSCKLGFEIQGKQHYEYIQFFHTNKLEFFRAQKLDSLKKQWCQLNNIRLIELPYNKSVEDWKRIIRDK